MGVFAIDEEVAGSILSSSTAFLAAKVNKPFGHNPFKT